MQPWWAKDTKTYILSGSVHILANPLNIIDVLVKNAAAALMVLFVS